MKTVLYYLMIGIFSCFPLDKNLYVFSNDGYFGDNTRAFFDYLLEHNFTNVHKIVWLMNDTTRYKKYKTKNVKFININNVVLRTFYLTRCICNIYTHGPMIRKKRVGQLFLHLSHSASILKGGKMDNEKSIDTHVRCGDDGIIRWLMTHPNTSKEQLPILGMSRLDLLYSHKECLSKLIPDYKNQRVIMTMETFKKSSKGVVYDDSDNTEDVFGINVVHSKEELLGLNSFLKNQNFIMIVKPHHKQDLSFLDFVRLDNILFVTDEQLEAQEIQLYELIENCDAMITDYSSVFYDFLLLDRPIGFVISDIQQYRRGFLIENPLEEMPGDKMTNIEQLKEFVLRLCREEDNYKQERKALRDRVFHYQDQQNSERLFQYIQTHLQV